jgi:hypothetical protein
MEREWSLKVTLMPRYYRCNEDKMELLKVKLMSQVWRRKNRALAFQPQQTMVTDHGSTDNLSYHKLNLLHGDEVYIMVGQTLYCELHENEMEVSPWRMGRLRVWKEAVAAYGNMIIYHLYLGVMGEPLEISMWTAELVQDSHHTSWTTYRAPQLVTFLVSFYASLFKLSHLQRTS